MLEYFSPIRFRRYFIKTVLEKPTQIGGIFLLSFAVALLIYFLLKSIANFEVAQLFSFTIGLIGGGCLLSSVVFGYFSDIASGASYLTLPASLFEKWLCAILIAGVIYTSCFLLYFRGLDTLFVHLYHLSLNNHDPRYREQYNSVFIFNFDGDTGLILIFFANAMAAMLVGSLYFNRAAFVKVALVVCGIYFFTFLLNYLISSFLFKGIFRAFPFHSISIKNGAEQGILALPLFWSNIYDAVASYGLPSALLIISFIRLTEKEI
ncbi:MAG TPA: hypothetical protein VGI38_00105 [Puia sp.]